MKCAYTYIYTHMYMYINICMYMYRPIYRYMLSPAKKTEVDKRPRQNETKWLTYMLSPPMSKPSSNWLLQNKTKLTNDTGKMRQSWRITPVKWDKVSYLILYYRIFSSFLFSSLLILSYPTLSYPILSYRILSDPILSYPNLSYLILS